MKERKSTPPPAAEKAAPAKGKTSRLIYMLITFSLMALLAPLYLITTTIQEENNQYTAEMAVLQQTLEADVPVSREEQELRDTLTQLREDTVTLNSVVKTLDEDHTAWSGVMVTISSYSPTNMAVQNIALTENRIVVSGSAKTENTVMEYARMLSDSDYFVRVSVQSIALKPAPTASSRATVTPSAPSPEDDLVVDFVIFIDLQMDLP